MKQMPSRSRRFTSSRKTLLSLALSPLLLAQAALPVIASGSDDNRFLDMDLVQLMQVTVTSVAKKPQTLADTAAAVFVITQEDIRRSGATSIPEALAMAPGLQVAQISSSKWSIASRGFGGYTSNKLLVMLDGRSVYTPAYSGTFWDMQNTLLEDIDRIEVIRGPGATIWGANAVNGVINIITKKAQDTQGGLIRAGAGIQEKATGAARYGGKIGESAFARFYVTGDDRASNELAGSDLDAHDGWSTMQTGFRADGTVGARNEWTLQGDLFRNDGDQIVFPFWSVNSAFPRADFGSYTADGGNLLGSWQHTLNNGDRLSLKGYYDRNNRDESYYAQSFTTLDLDLQYETAIGSRNKVTMGTGYRRIDGSFDDTFQVNIPNQTNDLYSAFLQDEINLVADRLWLTLGSKYEYNDFTGSEWQPSGRLLWKPQANHSVWASVARAVRTPSMVEDGGALTIAMLQVPTGLPSPFPPSFLLPLKLRGNSAFDVETLLAYEAGYRWQARRTLSFDLAAYYNDYQDIYGTLPTLNPPGLTFSNMQEGYGYGLELAANWQAIAWLNLAFTYSYQRLELEYQDNQIDALSFQDRSSSNTTPMHQASVRASIDLNDQWQFNTWLRYTDNIQGRNNINLSASIPVDDFIGVDANIIWKPCKDLEFMLAGQNLFNNSELEYIAELITPPTEIERVVYGKITWRF